MAEKDMEKRIEQLEKDVTRMKEQFDIFFTEMLFTSQLMREVRWNIMQMCQNPDHEYKQLGRYDFSVIPGKQDKRDSTHGQGEEEESRGENLP